MTAERSIVGREHWTEKGPVRLFLWEVPGRPDSFAMDTFARLGYDTWCVDMEGYGRSDKHRDINSNIANGADDLEAGPDHGPDDHHARPVRRHREH